MNTNKEQITENTKENEKKNTYKFDLSKFSAESCMDVFLELDDNRRYVKHFKTGFRAIDDITSGGFEIGFGIVNGVSGGGKTTLCAQIAYNMSSYGQPVIFFSLEMEKNAIFAKAISAQSFKDNGALFTVNQILSKELIINRPEEEKREYSQISMRCIENMKNVLVVDRCTIGKAINSDTIIEFVDDYIKQTGKKPVIFIDYLQRLAPNNDMKKASKMEIIDNNTEVLWDYAHTAQLCIVAISSLNRASYKDGATLEGNKGSGNIEYSADFGLGIQFRNYDDASFNFNEAKSKPIRDIELVVLKQRLGGGGMALPYLYYAAYNTFVEISDNGEDNISNNTLQITNDNALDIMQNINPSFNAMSENMSSSEPIPEEREKSDTLSIDEDAFGSGYKKPNFNCLKLS